MTAFAIQQQRFYRYCLLPTMAVLVVVVLLPTIYLVVTSFTPLDLARPDTQWNFSEPFAQYQHLWTDARLRNSLLIQAKLSFWTVLLQVCFGVSFAFLLNLRSMFLDALRTVFLIPMVLPPIVTAIIWKIFYTPDISPFHWLTEAIGFTVPPLITTPATALLAIIIADVWQWFPFVMLITLAALQTMPQEHIDAARVDGASAWQLTIYVTLPHLRAILIVAVLFRLVDSIKAFPLIFILTEGGPGTVTEVTNYYSYIQAFNFSYLGYSSAITVFLVTATALLSWLILRVVGQSSPTD